MPPAAGGDHPPRPPWKGEGSMEIDLKFFLKDIVSFFIDSFGNSPYIGEFGASVFSGKYGDLYLSALVRAFSILNLDWTFHSFRENAIWSPEGAGKENWSACKISQSRRIDILKGVS